MFFRFALKACALFLVAVPVHAQTADVQRILAEDAEIALSAVAISGSSDLCDLAAWSADNDRNGLNIRAQPSATGKVVGIVPPPLLKSRLMSEAGEEGPLRAEFRIRAYHDGWFYIDQVAAPRNLDKTEDRAKVAYEHQKGWVRASLVGAGFAGGGLPDDRLYAEPKADASFQSLGAGLVGGVGPKRLLACKGRWAKVETADGKTGWVRTLCSSQIATCN